MEKNLTEVQAAELCFLLRIINKPHKFIQEHGDKFYELYHELVRVYRTDWNEVYKRDNVNFCRSPDECWDAGR